jgi:AraC-like DNA-binding protein
MLANPDYLRESTNMHSDPFSDFLKFVSAQSVMTGGLIAGGSWAIRFRPPEKIKVFAVVKGRCWLVQDGKEAPIQVETGEVFLVCAPRSFVIASDLEIAPTDSSTVFTGNTGTVTKHGEGEDLFLIGGFVELDAAYGGLLLDVLPPVIHVRAESPQAAVLQWLLDQLVHERDTSRPGAGLASAQLAQLVFVQVLRFHLETSGPLAPGWLRVLTDQRLGPALRLMHGDPGRAWQLDELAKSVAMSRSTFAFYFKTVAGVPPLAYLHNWRMKLAERALREEDRSVSDLALSLGYTSESAFSNAFKRTRGMAPKRYRTTFRKLGHTVSNFEIASVHGQMSL